MSIDFPLISKVKHVRILTFHNTHLCIWQCPCRIHHAEGLISNFPTSRALEMMTLLQNFIFIIEKFITKIFFFIKSDKQVNTIDPFNKWVVLRLMNLDLFNKHVGLVLIHIVG